jgi:hypothetical protein
MYNERLGSENISRCSHQRRASDPYAFVPGATLPSRKRGALHTGWLLRFEDVRSVRTKEHVWSLPTNEDVPDAHVHSINRM